MADEPQKPPPQVRGITEDHWRGWERHPVTVLFRQYLSEGARSLEEMHLWAWRGRQLDPVKSAEDAAQAVMLEELSMLSFADVLDVMGDDNVQHEEEDQATDA